MTYRYPAGSPAGALERLGLDVPLLTRDPLGARLADAVAELTPRALTAAVEALRIREAELTAAAAAAAEAELDELRADATCSECGARTYRGEECVCGDGGDASAEAADRFDALTAVTR